MWRYNNEGESAVKQGMALTRSAVLKVTMYQALIEAQEISADATVARIRKRQLRATIE